MSQCLKRVHSCSKLLFCSPLGRQAAEMSIQGLSWALFLTQVVAPFTFFCQILRSLKSLIPLKVLFSTQISDCDWNYSFWNMIDWLITAHFATFLPVFFNHQNTSLHFLKNNLFSSSLFFWYGGISLIPLFICGQMITILLYWDFLFIVFC